MNSRAAGQHHPREGDVLVLMHVAEVVRDREPLLTGPCEGVTRFLLSNEDARLHCCDRAQIRRKVDHERRLGLTKQLERALTLAEPEGYVRVFVDEGPRLAALLQTAAKRGIAPGYVQRLLADFGIAGGGPHARQNLIEPLSERELDVLRLLATDLDGPEIASELLVSLNTMRTHTKSIYTKLGVNNRRAAVRRAEELALLSTSASR